MAEPNFVAPSVTVKETDVVLDHGGAFTLNLPSVEIASNVFLILDIYELDNPVHPEGHIGWWRYDVRQLTRYPTGKLFRDETGMVRPTIDGITQVDEWRNRSHTSSRRMELLVVLRSTITNAILFIDRVPVMQSDQDLKTFRSSFDRNYQSPRYAPPHYVLPDHRSIHIVSRNVFQRDAVGNLCLGLYRMLRQHNVSVHLFADNFDLAMNDIVNRRESLSSRIGSDDIIIYFFSIYDGNLDELVAMNCNCKIAYFHGITAPKQLQVFDPELGALCARAIKQIPVLGKFDRLAVASSANASVLREMLGKSDSRTTEDIKVIPPKLIGDDEKATFCADKVKARPRPPKLLHVGRIRSHKRIEDILHLLVEYRKLDPSAQCTIVGQSDNPAYRDYLRWVQTKQLNLPEAAVNRLGSVSEAELANIYDDAAVYVSMSEDEGFGLSLLEAMMRNVLVFAYDQPAVREIVGMAGVIFSDKAFENLARELHFLLSSCETCEKIIDAQRQKAAEFVNKMDGRGFLEILAVPGPAGV